MNQITIEYKCNGSGWDGRCNFYVSRHDNNYCEYENCGRCTNVDAIMEATEED